MKSRKKGSGRRGRGRLIWPAAGGGAREGTTPGRDKKKKTEEGGKVRKTVRWGKKSGRGRRYKTR